MHYREDR